MKKDEGGEPQAVPGAANKGPSQAEVDQKLRKYKPLNVDTWRQGGLASLGWILFITFAVITGGLNAISELLVGYPGDRDLRDMSYDTRISNRITERYHKNFLNSYQCCNLDPYRPDAYSSSQSCINPSIIVEYQRLDITCPVVINMVCPGGIITPDCMQLRRHVYRALGLGPRGEYVDCERAGRLRVGSWTGSQLALEVVAADDSTRLEKLVLNPATYDYDIVKSFVDSAVVKYGKDNFLQPEQQTLKAFALDGAPADLQFVNYGGKRGLKTINPWPVEIFPWPGLGKRCPNTAIINNYFYQGKVPISAVPLSYLDPGAAVSTLTFFRDSVRVPQYKVAAVVPSVGVKGVAVEGTPATTVRVQRLLAIQVAIGMALPAGACYAWMMDTQPYNYNLTYGPAIWTGPLAALLDPNNTVIPGLQYDVDLTVRDLSGPRMMAVPFYSGMYSICSAFVMAAFFLFSLAPYLLLAVPAIWLNVRSNRGLPPMVYKYMKRYRGW